MPDQKMITAPNVTEMKGNMVINNVYIEEGNCVNVWKIIIWLKKKPQTLFLIFIHVPIFE